MSTEKTPADEGQVLAFFNSLSDEELKDFLDRVVLGKKPKKAPKKNPEKFDLLCWQCEHARLKKCPQTQSGSRPTKGMQKCSDWITNPSVEYGDSPRKKRQLEKLLQATP